MDKTNNKTVNNSITIGSTVITYDSLIVLILGTVFLSILKYKNPTIENSKMFVLIIMLLLTSYDTNCKLYGECNKFTHVVVFMFLILVFVGIWYMEDSSSKLISFTPSRFKM